MAHVTTKPIKWAAGEQSREQRSIPRAVNDKFFVALRPFIYGCSDRRALYLFVGHLDLEVAVRCKELLEELQRPEAHDLLTDHDRPASKEAKMQPRGRVVSEGIGGRHRGPAMRTGFELNESEKRGALALALALAS